MLRTFSFEIKWFRRYVDDIAAACVELDVDQVLAVLNSCDSSVVVTLDAGETDPRSTTFLD